VRVLLCKPGLDGHDRGVKILALALRDGGLEVIYGGLHQSIEQIVFDAIQEDVDVVGVSLFSGAHMVLVPELVKQLHAAGAGDKRVVVGGFIPEEEERLQLEQLGVSRVFDQGTPLNEIVEYVRAIGRAR
jgi:methylmalonyl-CoA mutase C-terminal domain/subunit